MDAKRKVFTGEVVKADKGGPIVAVVSTQNVDYAGDVIMQGPTDKGRGWLLDDFNSRGRIYWMHDPFRPNLAKAKARVDGGRLLLEVQFDLADPFAADIDRKYREGFLSEWSVGFRPVEGKYEVNPEGGFTFYEQQLDEVSAVNQGMNPGTQTVSKAYGDYIEAASEMSARLDQIEAAMDKRLREVEAAVMRAATEKDRAIQEAQMKRIREALENLTRTGA